MLIIINKTNSVETKFYCPQCGHEHSFIGANTPVACRKCYLVFPDVLDMMFDNNERRKFHLKKGLSYQCSH